MSIKSTESNQFMDFRASNSELSTPRRQRRHGRHSAQVRNWKGITARFMSIQISQFKCVLLNIFLLKQIKMEEHDQQDEEQEDETDRSEIFRSHLFIKQVLKY